MAACFVVAFVATSAPPTAPPPKVPGAKVSPPPAWVEAGGRSVWGTYGSYCWSSKGKGGACVDMIPPTMRPDLARLGAARGSMVRIHLGLAPRTVRVYRSSTGTWIRVESARAGRTVSWRARPGIFDVRVSGAGGSASYLVRLTSSTRS